MAYSSLHETNIVTKHLLNQFGAAILGVTVTAATTKSARVQLFASIFAVIFYLFLLYTAMWDIGSKDKIKVDGGRMKPDSLRGLKASLLGNIPNYVLALGVTVGMIFGSELGPFAYGWAHDVFFYSNAAARLWQAMFVGVIKYLIPNGLGYGAQIAWSAGVFFGITLPSLAASGLGYYMGTRNITLVKKNPSQD